MVGARWRSRATPASAGTTAFGALVATFSQHRLHGRAAAGGLAGAQSRAHAIFVVLIDMVFTSSVCIALSRLDGAGAQGAGAAVRNALRASPRIPCPGRLRWARGLGFAGPAAGPVDKTVAMLAMPAIARGAVHHRRRAGPLADEPARTGARARLRARGTGQLLVHPLLVWCVGTAGHRPGRAAGAVCLTVLVLLAALPSASNVAAGRKFGATTGASPASFGVHRPGVCELLGCGGTLT